MMIITADGQGLICNSFLEKRKMTFKKNAVSMEHPYFTKELFPERVSLGSRAYG